MKILLILLAVVFLGAGCVKTPNEARIEEAKFCMDNGFDYHISTFGSVVCDKPLDK